LALPISKTSAQNQEPAKPKLAVGSKKFTENVLLGAMMTQLLRKTGFRVRYRDQLGGSRFLWNALRNGEIDAYPEYTGTILQELLTGEDVSRDSLRAALRERGLRMTEPLGFNNTYALAMREKQADRLDIETISDLTEHPSLTFGFTNEFMDREDGWPALRGTYDLQPQSVEGLDHDLAYQGIKEGAIDVIDIYSTDAEVAYYDLRVLKDNKKLFPAYRAVILYRADLQKRAPQAVRALKRLEGQISADTMTALNKRAKIDGVPGPKVAASFLNRTFTFAGSSEVEANTQSRAGRVWQRTKEHLWLVGVSLALAILLAVPIGVAAAKVRVLEQPILGAVGVIYTLPALAILVFMIPLFGIGTTPAMAALFLYSLLPIVRNTHAGLHDIPGQIGESADALGLTAWAKLGQIELPLAARSILAGVKTSAVINVGTATLGALIGAGGYGQPILTGIRLDDFGLIMEGAVPAALLALVAQGLFEIVERLVVSPGLRLSGE
jgi:osmoprotectant transport system permease protein